MEVIETPLRTQIQIPRPPNFIQCGAGDGLRSVPVGEFTDEVLEQIAAKWTQALLKRADEQRREKP